MAGHSATTLAYVRTSAGVVKVEPEGTLPEGVSDGEVERLTAAGVIEPAAKQPEQDNGGNTSGAGKGRGRS